MPQYTNDIAITFPGGSPLVGLGAGKIAISNPIDNTTDKFDVVDIQIKLKLGASGVVAGSAIRIGILASDDGGVTYDNYIYPNNLLETITTHIANGNTVIARVQLTNVPQFWKFAVNNRTGAAFDSSGGNFSTVYAGVINTGQLTLSTEQVNVTVSATLLASANNNRQNIVIANHGSDTIYLGDAAVTTSTGFALATNTSITLESFSGNALYGIVPSVTSLADIMQW